MGARNNWTPAASPNEWAAQLYWQTDNDNDSALPIARFGATRTGGRAA